MDGILLVNKPKGWTSFDVVAKVRGILRASSGQKKIKVGHTGTLDPAATGLLVLCIGQATKQVEQMIKHDKTYQVELTLGAVSTTGDSEGVITHKSAAMGLDQSVVLDTIKSFIGEQMQIPPAFSAIKINGQKAYDLARAGKEPKMEPRAVTIYDIRDIKYNWPKVDFTCDVSSGTYIRSLANDIGQKLGCGAYMSQLNRTRVADYRLDESLSIDELSAEAIYQHLL